MTNRAKIHITKIEFVTDATRDASSIPLGYLMEAVWQDHTRWVGIIGRNTLTDIELGKINLKTWPELSDPWPLLKQRLEDAKRQAWGRGGDYLANQFAHAFRCNVPVTTEEQLPAEDEADWLNAQKALIGKLMSFKRQLAPQPTPATVTPAHGDPVARHKVEFVLESEAA